MKLIVSCFGILFANALTVSAFASPADICPQVVQNITILAEAVAKNTRSYWIHRRNFANILYGSARVNSPGALQLADQEKIQAAKLKPEILSALASLLELNATGRSQHCLSSTELATAETAIKLAKRVNVDRFPHNEDDG